MFPACKNSQKWVKNQKSTNKHSSFDGLIQEDIDLSGIHLAAVGMVHSELLDIESKNHES